MKIDKVFGTGGIGSGIFFNLEGNHTIGRNESRLAHLTDYKDYCKCHIILHYVAFFTDCAVYAVGKVGDDSNGHELIEQMKSVGIKTDFVEKSQTAATMFAVCFQYPNGEGGNITTENSACKEVTPEYIEASSEGIDKNSLVLAAPEVPIESRIKLLEIGKSRGAYNVSSFLCGEAEEFIALGGILLSNLLSINIEEAGAVCKTNGTKKEIAYAAISSLLKINEKLKIIVSCGGDGAYMYDGREILHISAKKVDIVSTAGCGDALIGSTISGMIFGLGFASSVNFGTMVAAYAAQSPSSIAENIPLSLGSHERHSPNTMA